MKLMKLLPLFHSITVGKSMFAASPRSLITICLAVGTLFVLGTACTSPERSIPSPAETSPGRELSESAQVSDASSDSANQSAVDKTEAASSDDSSFEQVPEDTRSRILEAIATDLSQPASTLIVEAASAELWSDGCLGLAREGEFCTMALVDGWRIQISRDDNTIIYRSNLDGTVIRREP
ncbi:MAG: hypothetical protein F6K30_06100 [Cyanothece sp. SIO2G6]|nr:hypothetical protein [Cyanothece sp. SIO2G6]